MRSNLARSLSEWLSTLVPRPERTVRASTPGPSRHLERETSAGALRAGLRVLVVDDDPSNREEARALLRDESVLTSVAADGAEAVTLACEQAFDLILMDLQMPVLDGLAATKQIRNFEREHARARVPVLAYSSGCFDEDVLRNCGVDDVVIKPCDASGLHQCLLRWCVDGHDTEFRVEPCTGA